MRLCLLEFCFAFYVFVVVRWGKMLKREKSQQGRIGSVAARFIKLFILPSSFRISDIDLQLNWIQLLPNLNWRVSQDLSKARLKRCEQSYNRCVALAMEAQNILIKTLLELCKFRRSPSRKHFLFEHRKLYAKLLQHPSAAMCGENEKLVAAGGWESGGEEINNVEGDSQCCSERAYRNLKSSLRKKPLLIFCAMVFRARVFFHIFRRSRIFLCSRVLEIYNKLRSRREREKRHKKRKFSAVVCCTEKNFTLKSKH